MCEGSKPRLKIGFKVHRSLPLDVAALARYGWSAGLAIKCTLMQARVKSHGREICGGIVSLNLRMC